MEGFSIPKGCTVEYVEPDVCERVAALMRAGDGLGITDAALKASEPLREAVRRLEAGERVTPSYLVKSGFFAAIDPEWSPHLEHAMDSREGQNAKVTIKGSLVVPLDDGGELDIGGRSFAVEGLRRSSSGYSLAWTPKAPERFVLMADSKAPVVEEAAVRIAPRALEAALRERNVMRTLELSEDMPREKREELAERAAGYRRAVAASPATLSEKAGGTITAEELMAEEERREQEAQRDTSRDRSDDPFGYGARADARRRAQDEADDFEYMARAYEDASLSSFAVLCAFDAESSRDARKLDAAAEAGYALETLAARAESVPEARAAAGKALLGNGDAPVADIAEAAAAWAKDNPERTGASIKAAVAGTKDIAARKLALRSGYMLESLAYSEVDSLRNGALARLGLDEHASPEKVKRVVAAWKAGNPKRTKQALAAGAGKQPATAEKRPDASRSRSAARSA